MLFFLKFWETFLKSNLTKKKFVKKIIENLNNKWITNIQFRNAYLLVETDKPVQELQNIFWVQKIEEIKYRFFYEIDPGVENKETIVQQVFKDISTPGSEIIQNYNFSSFRLSVKREDKTFPVNSMDIQMILWKSIQQNFWKKASYKEYELNINIRILKNEIWIWTNQDSYQGIGGLPYWIEWKSLNLFSWWIDSPVATFLAAKRWIKQHFLFLNIPGSSLLLQQVYEIYQYLQTKYWIQWKFFTINLKPYISKIKQNIPAGYRQIIFKKLLYKISDIFAYKLRVKSVVNGENLWQVSTQTLSNMELLDKENNLLNIRPLICYDKVEIIELAKKIWTYKFSEKIKETCSLEEHSDSRIKNTEKIDKLFDELWFDIYEIVGKAGEIKKSIDLDILKYKVSSPKGMVIDIEKIDKIPTLEGWKEYTFTCSSGYKASEKVLEYRKKWYNVYFM